MCVLRTSLINIQFNIVLYIFPLNIPESITCNVLPSQDPRNQIGAFLVRFSPAYNDRLFLSVLAGHKEVINFVIRYRSGQYSVSDRSSFPSLSQLVAHYCRPRNTPGLWLGRPVYIPNKRKQPDHDDDDEMDIDTLAPIR